jgi:hypothetical protein
MPLEGLTVSGERRVGVTMIGFPASGRSARTWLYRALAGAA